MQDKFVKKIKLEVSRNQTDSKRHKMWLQEVIIFREVSYQTSPRA